MIFANQQEGRLSVFGGPDDKGMINDTGLALYEPWEADRRPDIFTPAPADDPKMPTWKRLRTDFPYIAMRFDKALPRDYLQWTPFRVMNPDTKQFVTAFLVDWGPNANTGRVVDVSPIIASRLRLQTDDKILVGMY